LGTELLHGHPDPLAAVQTGDMGASSGLLEAVGGTADGVLDGGLHGPGGYRGHGAACIVTSTVLTSVPLPRKARSGRSSIVPPRLATSSRNAAYRFSERKRTPADMTATSRPRGPSRPKAVVTCSISAEKGGFIVTLSNRPNLGASSMKSPAS